jgi:O-antigen ligase
MNVFQFIKPYLHHLNIIPFFCALVIPSIVTGSFIPDLLISSLSLWFLYFAFKNKIFYIFKNIYFYIFFCFYLFCILSSLLSDNILFSLKSSFFFIRIAIFSLLIAYLIDQNKKILDIFYYTFLITFTILVIDSFIQFFLGYNMIGLPRPGVRVSSFFGSEFILGSYLSRLFPLFIALFFIKEKKNYFEIFFFIILSVGIYMAVLFSGGRSSFLFMNLGLVFILIFIRNHLNIKLIFIGLISILLLISFFKQDRISQRWLGPVYTPNAMIKNFFDNEEKDNVIISKAHDSFLKTSWRMFIEKPILGHGPKMFRVKCNEWKLNNDDIICSTHPHNFYAQLLAETGLVGFLFLFGLLFYFIFFMIKYLIYDFFKNKASLSKYKICLLAGLLITIWPLSTNGNFFNNKLMIIYGLQIGFFKKMN